MTYLNLSDHTGSVVYLFRSKYIEFKFLVIKDLWI